jgi:site-specific recombinase XerD
MNEFISVFSAELNEYLAMRGKVLTPESLRIDRHVLTDFDTYAAASEVAEKRVTEDMVTGWIARLREKNHSRTVSNKVSNLRKFFEYLKYSGLEVFMPLCPQWNEDYIPYIFSDAEMKKIFHAADKAETTSFNRFEFPMVLRLLYGCGLRLGEALSLIVSDVDWRRGTLIIRVAKNNKQRLVPMHGTLSKMLMQYCAAMDIIEKPDAFLFPGAKLGSHWSPASVSIKFKQALKSTGVYVKPGKAGQRGQCLHCLRHLFAVKSFAQADGNGRLTNDSVPYLSVYLGHYDMDGTEKYLKFSSDIFPEHTKMFTAYSAGVFSVLGGAE